MKNINDGPKNDGDRCVSPSEPKWGLVAHPELLDSERQALIMALTEDCLEVARARGWVVLGSDSEVYKRES